MAEPGEPDESSLPERQSAESPDAGEVVSGEISGDQSARAEKAVEIVVEEFRHTGPLPAQQWFQAIEPLCPGGTELILTDYRSQRQHEREMEQASLELDRESLRAFAGYQTMRLAIAGAIALLAAAAAIVLVAVGRPVTGFALVIAEIAALVLAFFGSRARNGDDDDDDAATDTEVEPPPPSN